MPQLEPTRRKLYELGDLLDPNVELPKRTSPFDVAASQAQSISAPQGILQNVRANIQRYMPNPVLDTINMIPSISTALGLDDPGSAFAGGPVVASTKAVAPFFSKVKDGLVKLGNKFTGQQGKATLRKMMTKAEFEERGLDLWLDDATKYSKDDLVEFVRAHDEELRLDSHVLSDNPLHDFDEVEGTIVPRQPDGPTYYGEGNLRYRPDDAYNYTEEFVTAPNNSKRWQDGHADYYDVRNPVVRIRYDQRPIKDGNALFIDEMQPPGVEEQGRMPKFLIKRWRELGTKKAVRRAAEADVDYIAWTDGNAQIKRYPGSEKSNLGNVYDIDIPNQMKKLGLKPERVTEKVTGFQVNLRMTGEDDIGAGMFSTVEEAQGHIDILHRRTINSSNQLYISEMDKTKTYWRAKLLGTVKDEALTKGYPMFSAAPIGLGIGLGATTNKE